MSFRLITTTNWSRRLQVTTYSCGCPNRTRIVSQQRQRLLPSYNKNLSTNNGTHTSVPPKQPPQNQNKPTSSTTPSASTNKKDSGHEVVAAAAAPEEHAKPFSKPPPLLNPFPLLASATEEIDLTSRLRSYSNTFGIIGALMCTISISALSFSPSPALEDIGGRYSNAKNDNEESPLPPSLLVKYFNVNREYLGDIYASSWIVSFYTSAIGLGLSTIIAGVVTSTAPSFIKIFVRRHSNMLTLLPVCQVVSAGFAGAGLFVGIDQNRGEPVSWVALAGSLFGGSFLALNLRRVLKGYNEARTTGKVVTAASSASASANTTTASAVLAPTPAKNTMISLPTTPKKP